LGIFHPIVYKSNLYFSCANGSDRANWLVYILRLISTLDELIYFICYCITICCKYDA